MCVRHFFLQDDYLGNGVNEQDNVENPWWVGSVSSTPMAMFGRLNGGPDPTICQFGQPWMDSRYICLRTKTWGNLTRSNQQRILLLTCIILYLRSARIIPVLFFCAPGQCLMVAYTNPVLVRGFISTLNMRWWSRMTLPYFSGGWLNHRPDFMGDFIWPVPKIPTSGLWVRR